jgi:hypothetical protein
VISGADRFKNPEERLKAGTMESSRLKLDRAWEHLTSLEDEVEAFLKREPYEFDWRFDGNLRIMYIFVTPTEELPVKWAIVLGDILHNLNSALDHLVCSLARLSDSEDDCTATEFPVFTGRAGFEGKKERALRGVPEEAQGIIEELQPFNSGEDPTMHVLEVLRRFYNIDKHRRLHLVVGNLREAHYTPTHPDVVPIRMHAGPIRGRTELAAFHAPPHVEDIQRIDTDVSFDVVIDEPIGPEDFQTPNISTGMRSIHRWISTKVLPRFERFFA